MQSHAANPAFTPPSLWRRAGSMLLAFLLLALGLLDASPSLHAALHHDHENDHAGHHHETPPEGDHGCAVLLYAQGVTSPPPALFVEPPTATSAANNFPLPHAPIPQVTRGLRPPGRGPPDIR